MSPVERSEVTNPNHHLWNNHGTWWVHATVLHGGIRQERVRRSMGTSDLHKARVRRDIFLAELARRSDLTLSIRIGHPRARMAGPVSRREIASRTDAAEDALTSG